MIHAIDIYNNGVSPQVPDAQTTGSFQAINFIMETFLVKTSTSTSLSTPEPRVVSTIGVCGGKPRIAGTRVAVWAIESAWRLGCSDREIMRMYPSVDRQDLRATKDYIRSHKSDIDRQIAENEV